MQCVGIETVFGLQSANYSHGTTKLNNSLTETREIDVVGEPEKFDDRTIVPPYYLPNNTIYYVIEIFY